MAIEPSAHLIGSDVRQLTESEQRAFFDTALDRALAAEHRTGAIDRDIILLDATIRLRFAGQALHDAFMPALAHIAVPRTEHPDGVFHIWDSDASGVAMTPAPCPVSSFTHRGDIWTMLSRRIRSAFQSSQFALSLLDLERKQGIYWTRSAAELPYWSKAAPLCALFSWWIAHRGGQLLHGAAVATADGGILLTGKGGVGKSTTALQCLAAGFRFAGDDYVAVTGGNEPEAHSLYCTAKINRTSSVAFADFAPRFGDDRSEKAVCYLYPDRSELLARSLPIRAILTPEIRGTPETIIERAPRRKLVEAASFTTIAQLPHAGQSAIRFVEDLLDSVPSFTIGLGSDRPQVAAAIASFLKHPHAIPELSPEREARATMPLVSVIIPVFDGARFLPDAIASIVGQGHEPLDIIVVDDGSRDDIDDAVAALPCDVRLLKQAHAGPGAARNAGIRNATADFIAFLDVDDLWLPDMLQVCLEAFETAPDLDVVIGDAQHSKFDPETGEWVYIGDAQETFPFHISAAMFRRRAFEQVGLFDEKMEFDEDLDWFMRARDCRAIVEHIDRPALLVRRHESNMTFGRTKADLTPERLLKNLLDRRRERAKRG